MSRLLASTLVPLHRVFFVVATALLGVAGSYVANHPDCIANWLAFAGTGLGMYVGDVCREIDSTARQLAAGADLELKRVRVSLTGDKKPALLFLLAVMSMGLTASGFAFGG